MKKLLLATSVLFLGMSIAHTALADCNGMYLGVRGGVVHYKDDASDSDSGIDKNKLMLSGALGYRHDYFRVELEYVWRDKNEHSYSSGGVNSKVNFKTYSYMLNGYIDLAPYSWFTPYIGAGIGFTKLKYSEIMTSPLGQTAVLTNTGNYKPTRLTWSVGGGVSVKVTNRFNVDAGYRYYDMNSLRHIKNIDAHEIYGGVRYVF